MNYLWDILHKPNYLLTSSDKFWVNVTAVGAVILLCVVYVLGCLWFDWMKERHLAYRRRQRGGGTHTP